MKLIKMSLVAALLAGTSAFAIENTKVSGDVNVFYHTQDAATTPDALTGSADGSLFSKDSSFADASLNLAISTDLAKNDLVKLSANASYTVLSTLGLENNLVSNVWGGAHGQPTFGTGASFAGSDHGAVGSTILQGAKVENASWMTEAYATVAFQKATKSAIQLGRMQLDTPLAFTETWSIEKNTFEAAVLMNQDLPDTTIVAAFVGNGNGNEAFGQDLNDATDANNDTLPDAPTVTNLGMAAGAVVNPNGDFTTFGTDGAYAFGLVNNSFKPLTAQAWYYTAPELATAYFVEADLAMDGIMAGAQYVSVTVDEDAATALGVSDDASGTMAAMVGYEMKDTVTVKAAYSKTSDEGALHGANLATGSGASKLYTEAWWMYGYVTAADTTGMSLSVEAPVAGIDLGLYYTQTSSDVSDEVRDLTITATKEFGPLAASLAFINYDVDEQTGTDSDAVNNIQAYLTLAF